MITLETRETKYLSTIPLTNSLSTSVRYLAKKSTRKREQRQISAISTKKSGFRQVSTYLTCIEISVKFKSGTSNIVIESYKGAFNN